MKSFFLEPIESRKAAHALDEALPGQKAPWLLNATSGDPIAYFRIERDDEAGADLIQADLSGRHFDRDADVLSVLQRLQRKLGGEIKNDD